MKAFAIHSVVGGCSATNHRHEHQRIVEEVQLEARDPQLRDARRDRSAEKRRAQDRLRLQQRVLDVMPKLDDERGEPPGPGPADKARL